MLIIHSTRPPLPKSERRPTTVKVLQPLLKRYSLLLVVFTVALFVVAMMYLTIE